MANPASFWTYVITAADGGARRRRTRGRSGRAGHPGTAARRHEATIRGWLDAIPDEKVRVRPVLAVGFVGGLMSGGEFEGVEQRLLDVVRSLLMAGANALLLGTLMDESRLVPRFVPLMGLIGAPLLIAATTATMFGVFEQVSARSAIATLPVAAWELSVGTWMVVKGFNPSPLTAQANAPADRRPELSTV